MRPLFLIFFLFFGIFAYAQEDEGGLRVTGLAAVDGSAIGTLRPSNGGFSADFWHSLSAEQAIASIRALPTSYDRWELFSLARSVLLTASPLNYGDSASIERQTTTTRQFISSRILKLYEMGLYSDAWELLDLMPLELYDNSFERLAIDLQLHLGENEAACEVLPANNELPPSDDNFWQKLLFLCEILEDDFDEAEFIFNVFREVNVFSDNFILLGEQALGITPTDDLSVGDNDVISQTLQDIAKPLSFDEKQNYSIISLQRLLQSSAVSDENKALIGLRLYRQAVINDETLTAIYAKLSYKKSRAKAVRLTQNDYPHAYKALSGDRENNDSKAKIIRSLALVADAEGSLPATLRQLSPYLALQPNEKLKDYAKILSVATLYKGDIVTATAWNKIAKDGDKTTLYDLLLPLSEADLIPFQPIRISDIYSQQNIKLIDTTALLLADEIMRERRENLIDIETWESLQTGEEEVLSVNNKLLLKSRLLEAQLANTNNSALLEFLRFGDSIAREDAKGYIRLWRLVDLPNLSRQAILGYFLRSGFVLGDD